MVQQHCQGETTNSESPLQDRNNLQRVKISVVNFKANREVFNRQSQEMTRNAGKTFDLFKVTSFIVVTLNLEFNSMCRKNWNTLMLQGPHTNLDGLQENRTDDYWKVDANRSLSESWTGFAKFTLLEENPPRGGKNVVREETDTNSSNYQTWECVAWSMDQDWKSRSEEREREKQEWAIEKPKLDNARRLRGIYLIDPDDGE